MCHRNWGGERGRGSKPPDLRPASNHVADTALGRLDSPFELVVVMGLFLLRIFGGSRGLFGNGV